MASRCLPLPELCAADPCRRLFRKNLVVESGCARQCEQTMALNFKSQDGPTRNAERGTRILRADARAFVGGTKLHQSEMKKWCRNGAETMQFFRSFNRAGAGLQKETKRIRWNAPLTPSLLYVCFHLPCLAESQTGRWGRLPPGRGEGGGADALVAL